MRAKTINEVQKFERGVPAKAALGVGGLVLGKELWNRKEKYINDWKKFLEKSLLNKTIYGNFAKYSWKEGDSVPNFDGWANYKVEVERVIITDGATKEGLPIELRVVGKDGAWYNIPIDDRKIYIK